MREIIIRTVISIISVFILIAGFSVFFSSCAQELNEESSFNGSFDAEENFDTQIFEEQTEN